MNPNELIQQIPTGPIEHFYFLYGAERFYQVEIIKAIKRQLITDDNCDFNLETFDAKSSSLNQWIGSVKTLSFLGGTKLVIVRNLHDVSNQKDLEGLNLQALIDYAKTPLAEACLVITTDKVDRRLKLIKTLTELKSAVCCEPPDPKNYAEKRRLWTWVQARAKESGYSISKNAAESLGNRVGNRPGILAQELEKLLVYAGKNKSISESDIMGVIGEAKQDIWDLNDALMGKQTERALKLLQNQLDNGVAPEQILGAISGQLRTVWEVKNYQEQGHPANQIAKKMGAHSYTVQKALEHTQKFSVQQLRRYHAELVQADRSLKSTSHREEVMKTLILNLCILGTTT